MCADCFLVVLLFLPSMILLFLLLLLLVDCLAYITLFSLLFSQVSIFWTRDLVIFGSLLPVLDGKP